MSPSAHPSGLPGPSPVRPLRAVLELSKWQVLLAPQILSSPAMLAVDFLSTVENPFHPHLLCTSTFDIPLFHIRCAVLTFFEPIITSAWFLQTIWIKLITTLIFIPVSQSWLLSSFCTLSFNKRKKKCKHSDQRGLTQVAHIVSFEGRKSSGRPDVTQQSWQA
jgi:hypothetical protein